VTGSPAVGTVQSVHLATSRSARPRRCDVHRARAGQPERSRHAPATPATGRRSPPWSSPPRGQAGLRGYERVCRAGPLHESRQVDDGRAEVGAIPASRRNSISPSTSTTTPAPARSGCWSRSTSGSRWTPTESPARSAISSTAPTRRWRQPRRTRQRERTHDRRDDGGISLPPTSESCTRSGRWAASTAALTAGSAIRDACSGTGSAASCCHTGLSMNGCSVHWRPSSMPIARAGTCPRITRPSRPQHRPASRVVPGVTTRRPGVCTQ
jgi:hypothetical protein